MKKEANQEVENIIAMLAEIIDRMMLQQECSSS